MSQRTPRLLLEEMLESIKVIQQYTQGLTKAQFLSDQRTSDAVIRRFEILGEATIQLPADWKANQHSVSWQQISGMRNALIHGYFIVNLDIVWDTIQNDLSPLAQQLATLIAQEP